MNIQPSFQRIGKVFEAYQSSSIKPSPKADKTRQSRDEVNISPEAKLFDFAKRAAAVTPDVREDKVAELSKRFSSGTYNVNELELAQSILN